MFFKTLRWLFGLFLLLLVLYGLGRLLHIAQDSLYIGERASYLQLASHSQMTVRWQSIKSYQGELRYGPSPDKLDGRVSEVRNTNLHEITIRNLKAMTRYYYRYGIKGDDKSSGQTHWFVTSPEMGSEKSTRFWVLGDPGLAIPGQTKVRNAALEWLKSNKRPGRADLDILLTTGDNAYKSGTNEEFQKHFFEPFKTILSNVPVWPVFGNHDARRWSFFRIFSFPTQGEAGGVPSGTEHYYSFDYGSVHFVVLDSHASRWNNNREMVKWLRKDLIANRLPWVISLFHHPPYSKGSHNSDSQRDSRGRMFEMRENVLPVLEEHGVDLVLNGHSHMYERSFLIDCHYGNSQSIKKSMILSRNKQHYVKRSIGKGKHEGTIYAVVGSSARADHGPMDHPVMAESLMETGSLVVDVVRNRLDARFISGEGLIADHFSITKGVNNATVNGCE
ncbi:MAG: metallophosphoesterase family protein [Gammaproteobacteria bacterium]|nr:metallophosphoesterase family protein [Gammaproteobacteria bacterium]